MSQISNVYILLNRGLPVQSRDSSLEKILGMTANGRTYASQMNHAASVSMHVVGDFDVRDQSQAFARLAVVELLQFAHDRSELNRILSNLTFGWFEFDNGIRGAIVANFGASIDRTSIRTPASPTYLPVTSEFRHADVVSANTSAELERVIAQSKTLLALNFVLILSGAASLIYIFSTHDKDGVTGATQAIHALSFLGVALGIGGVVFGFECFRCLREAKLKLAMISGRY